MLKFFFIFLFQVYKAQHKQTGQLAAAKMCVLDNEDDLADFTVEIDILSECRHPNVVELHEAYFIDNKLWVRHFYDFCSPWPLIADHGP